MDSFRFKSSSFPTDPENHVISQMDSNVDYGGKPIWSPLRDSARYAKI